MKTLKKVLFVATVDYHFQCFHIPYLKWFKDNGFEVHVAAKGKIELPFVDKKINIPFSRSPFHNSNINVYKFLKELIQREDYKLIHCHTPVGGLLTRLAARQNRKKSHTKVIYTAHGFHFFKGAPLLNWLLFYPIEKWLSRYTDCLITINSEDFLRAKRVFPKTLVEHVHGVGVDPAKYYPPTLNEKLEIRKQYGFNEEDCILIYVAELNKNKHQDLLIHAIKKVKLNFPEIKLLLVGNGPLEEQYKLLAKEQKVDDDVLFLGYRNDIHSLLQISDLAVSSSRREGLPVNVMEAMSVGLPIVSTNVRGSRDLVVNGKNGFLVEVDDIEGFIDSIKKIVKSKTEIELFGKNSLELIEKFSLKIVSKEMEQIYKKFI
ncbi:MAG: glycosyl transferase [Bacillales bacterium]|nr:glycosyl transferase [Bacillales bacterium]